MKQVNFQKADQLKAMAIVRVFETGKAAGDYAACVVLDDGAGISYGINQFTHRSGSLLAVCREYLRLGGSVGREVVETRLPVMSRSTVSAIAKLSADEQFKRALKAAAATREMREAQERVAISKYLAPAIAECGRLGFILPLSLAVVYDSMVHGSWERLRDTVGAPAAEKRWITEYVRVRDRWLRSVARLKATAYRTDFFLKQIELGKWGLDLPMTVHGVRVTERLLESAAHTASETNDIPPAGPDPTTAVRPSSNGGPRQNDPQSTSETGGVKAVSASQDRPADAAVSGPAGALDRIEVRVNEIASKVDQAERIVVTTSTRTDKAKSLWTTVAGTTWQVLWAVCGFLAGMPREVWLVVAVIAGALALLFLYRQIVMGRIRETGGPEQGGQDARL